MELEIKLDGDIFISVTGSYDKGEPENNVPEEWELDEIEILYPTTLFSYSEWVASKGSGWLEEINRLCIEKVNEK